MGRIALAVILSLVYPGLGQIYNREHKKGWSIIAVSSLIGVGIVVWLARLIAGRITSTDPYEMNAAAAQVMKESGHTVLIAVYVLIGIWAYAITQSYFKAKDIADAETDDSPEL